MKCEEEVEGDPSLKAVSYESSPIMSTYLLAFVVGEYDYVEGTDADGVLIRVYTPVGKKEQGQFALDVRMWLLIRVLINSKCGVFLTTTFGKTPNVNIGTIQHFRN